MTESTSSSHLDEQRVRQTRSQLPLGARSFAAADAIASEIWTGQSALVVDAGAERELEARWCALVDVALGQLPEIADEFEADTVRTPAIVWTTIVLKGLDHDGVPVRLDPDDFWTRVLRVVEVVEEALALLADDPAADEDASELFAFSTAGILCDLSRTRSGLAQVLPIMGPLTVAACRDEIRTHQASRGFNSRDVDWSSAGTKFEPLPVGPSSILPGAR